jgi:uncharacterized protein (TIRG00374 family)
MAWAKRAFFLIALTAVVYFLLPRIGGLRESARALAHARLWIAGIAVGVEAASLLSYALLYRTILRQMGHPVRVFVVAEVTMATFLISHLVPGGSAAGTAVNVDAMQDQGVPASTTAVAVLLTSLISAVAILILFAAGLAYSLAKRSLPFAYVTTAAIALPILAGLIGLVVLASFRPSLAASAGRLLGRGIHRLRRSVDPEALAGRARGLARQARRVFDRRAFSIALGFGVANWLVDAFVLYLMFLAVGFHQHFGAVLVAYSIANLLAVIPLTPGGLGIVEATLVALSIPFGAPRQIAVVAVIGYRLIEFWLPLPVGAVAYAHLRFGGKGRRTRRRS